VTSLLTVLVLTVALVSTAAVFSLFISLAVLTGSLVSSTCSSWTGWSCRCTSHRRRRRRRSKATWARPSTWASGFTTACSSRFWTLRPIGCTRPTLEGVFPKINEVYMFVIEMNKALTELKAALSLAPRRPTLTVWLHSSWCWAPPSHRQAGHRSSSLRITSWTCAAAQTSRASKRSALTTKY